MPKFNYKAKEGPGKIIDGAIEADNLDMAVSKVIKLGLTPIDISQSQQSEQKKARKSSLRPQTKFLKKVSLKDLVLFTRQMTDLVDASVPILRSLQLVINQTQNLYFREVIERMYGAVKDGSSFSDALAQHPRIFPSLYINMVKTGEVSGQLEIILNRLAGFLEREQDVQSRVRSSLAYPFLILIVGVVTMAVLLTFVIPRLSVMFDDLDQKLPMPTLILMAVSSVFARYWWLILVAIVGAGIYVKQWVSSPVGRMWFDKFKLKIPIFGDFLRIVEIGRFSRTLGTLVESGVSMTTALKSVNAIIENSMFKEEMRLITEQVTNGSSLRSALRSSRFFPEMAINMISVGEETGRLDRSLHKVADTFERQSEETMKTFVSLLGPIVLVLIVAVVGFVVIAMLLPIFKMNLLVQ